MQPPIHALVQLARPSGQSRRRSAYRAVLLLTVALSPALLAVSFWSSVADAVAPTFAAKQDFAANASPQHIAVGDLNGDGKLDLAIPSDASATVSVFLNSTAPGAAAPSFAAKQDFGTAAIPVSVALGDVNGDGKLDLAVTNAGLVANSVSVLLNTTTTGAMTVSFAAKQDFATGFSPVSVAVRDLNGDGNPDLVAANNDSDNVSVLINNTAAGAAAPNFAAKQDFTTGTMPRSIKAADLNGDGKIDLAVANSSSNTVSVLLSTTTPGAVPSFAAKQDFATGLSPRSVAVGDMNGDGNPDLVAANSNSDNVSVLLNNAAPGAATPSFAAKQDFSTGSSPRSVKVDDLNGDGRLDLVVASFGSNNLSLLVNTTAPGAATPSFAPGQNFTTGTGPQFVTTGDLNSDGKLDLIASNFSANTLSVLLNTTDQGPSTPSFTAKQDFATANFPASVAAGDLNGDGKFDLAVVASSNAVSVLLNTMAPGAATPNFAAKLDFATDFNPQSVAMGDLNGDGRLDLAIANVTFSTVSVLLNTAVAGTVMPSFAARQDFAASGGPRSVAMGDLNGDGRLDLAMAGFNSNVVTVRLNTTLPGDSTASFAAVQDFTTGTNPTSVTLGDLNGDGRLDLALANANSNNVSVLLNITAPGAIAANFAAKQDFTTGTRPVFVTLGDLNSDGLLDLAATNETGNTVSVLLNTTAPGVFTPAFAAKQDFTTGTTPKTVQVGDLNGDGRLDLAVANSASNTLSVLLNTTAPGASAPTFAAKQDFTTATEPVSVALGDLNLDGRPDLMAASRGSNSVSVLLNSSTIVAATGLSRQQGSAASNSQIATVTDYGGNSSVSVTVTSANPSNGVNISNIVNTGGNITADIVASCSASNASFTLQAGSMATATLNIAVTPNTAPTLTYTTPQSVAFNGSVNVSSTTASDNGSITGYAVQSVVPGLTTAPTVNASGVVAITNAQPAGSHVITIRVTDNCGITTDAAFTLNVSKGNQTITVGTHAPANAAFNSSFTVAATSSSGLPVSYSSAGACTNVGATFTMTSSTGTCTVRYDQAGDSNFNAATQVTESVTAQKANQTITVGTHAPANALFNTSFTVAATSNSGLPVVYNPSGVCTIAGATFTMRSGTGTCTVSYDQVGDTNYNPAPQVTESVTAQKASTSTAVTSSVNPSALAQSVTFTATVTSAVGTPTAGTVQFKIDGVNSGSPILLNGSGTAQLATASLTAATHTVTADYNGSTNFIASAATLAGGQVVNNRPLLSFAQATYNVDEATGFITITVARTGDLSVPVTVDYTTEDDLSSRLDCRKLNSMMASMRCDFTLTLGTLRFAAGETQKTFTVPITQDSFTEGVELFDLILSAPTGTNASLTDPSTARVAIADSTPPAPNANDDTTAFVRQQYRDFLAREADPAGLAFWKNNIDECNDPARRPASMTLVQCLEVRRIDTSAAFFLSIEFQQTGNLVRNIYVASLNRPLTNNMPDFVEFERDRQAIANGVIVGQGNWQQTLLDNRDTFLREFVLRAEFVGLYPTTDTPTQYVDKLYLHAGITPTLSERAAAIAEFGGATTAADAAARGRALLDVTQNTTFQQREANRSFVQMEYFGYLRRNPNDAPDGNFAGFDFWLTKLNAAGGNYISSEMVKAFLSSIEYRQRFGP